MYLLVKISEHTRIPNRTTNLHAGGKYHPQITYFTPQTHAFLKRRILMNDFSRLEELRPNHLTYPIVFGVMRDP